MAPELALNDGVVLGETTLIVSVVETNVFAELTTGFGGLLL
jgi:hypothetical protein